MAKTAILGKPDAPPDIVTIDDATAGMMDYARGAAGRSRIAAAREEIASGNYVVADDAYFASLNERIAARAAAKPQK